MTRQGLKCSHKMKLLKQSKDEGHSIGSQGSVMLEHLMMNSIGTDMIQDDARSQDSTEH